ncbi:thioredoxin TrxC [Aliikangiella sp. IMCC44653]
MSNKIRLVCPNCDTINQFPVERLDDKPKCAKCKLALFDGQPIEANSGQVVRHIENSDLPLLIDFWAPWCGPCINFAPVFEEFAGLVGNQLRLIKVNTEANKLAAMDFNIRSIPTLAIYRGGQELNRVSGAFSLAQLQQWVVQQLTNPEFD